MRLVALEAYLAELICTFGLGDKLVGVSHRFDKSDPQLTASKITVERTKANLAASKLNPFLRENLSPDLVDVDALRLLAPSHVLTRTARNDDRNFNEGLRNELCALCGTDVKLLPYRPTTLERVFDTFEDVAKDLGVRDKGVQLTQRTKAQCMDWCDNFYDRMKNKKVTFISSVDPLRLAGKWIPDMIHMASATSQVKVGGEADASVSWDEIVNFRPDVIIVAPRGKSLDESMKAFKTMEKFPHWDEIPAVKRGEVAFTDGKDHFFSPDQRIIESMGILVSAIAGMDSGYISARDCFYRLRWMEMQRHRY